MQPPLPIHLDRNSRPLEAVPFALEGGASDLAYPDPGGVTLNQYPFGAHRITGGSSRKNRKSGDFDSAIPDRR